MIEEVPPCPYCSEQFTTLSDYWKHVQSANCSGGNFLESDHTAPSAMLSKPPDADFFSKPLAPSAFRSPDTTTTSGASVSMAGSDPVGTCNACGLTFYELAEFKAHIASEEHKARIASAPDTKTKSTAAAKCDACGVEFTDIVNLKAHIASPEHKSMVATVSQHEASSLTAETAVAACKLCGVNFSNPDDLKTHIASPAHVARLGCAKKQERPSSSSPPAARPFRCMCCDVSFSVKSELQEHLATPEHTRNKDLMLQNKDNLPVKAPASLESATSNILSKDTRGNLVRPPASPSPPISLGALPGKEKNEALVDKVHEEVRSSPAHAARINGEIEQGRPCSAPGPLRCMCCKLNFRAKSELQQHLASAEHKRNAELMRQNNPKCTLKVPPSLNQAASNVLSSNTFRNEAPPVVHPPPPYSSGTLPGREELAQLVSELCEEMRPFIKSEICRLLGPIFTPKVDAPARPLTAIPRVAAVNTTDASIPPSCRPHGGQGLLSQPSPVIISKGVGLYCTVCDCALPGSGNNVEQHLSGKKHQSKL